MNTGNENKEAPLLNDDIIFNIFKKTEDLRWMLLYNKPWLKQKQIPAEFWVLKFLASYHICVDLLGSHVMLQ